MVTRRGKHMLRFATSSDLPAQHCPEVEFETQTLSVQHSKENLIRLKMASTEHPRLLLPHGAEKANAYFCLPINASLAARSPVIETLKELHGEPEVLAGVTTEDFLAWTSSDTSAACALPDDAIAQILQVWTLFQRSYENY